MAYLTFFAYVDAEVIDGRRHVLDDEPRHRLIRRPCLSGPRRDVRRPRWSDLALSGVYGWGRVPCVSVFVLYSVSRLMSPWLVEPSQTPRAEILKANASGYSGALVCTSGGQATPRPGQTVISHVPKHVRVG